MSEDDCDLAPVMGRPTLFKPEFVEQAQKLCKLGATDREIADFFKVDVATIYRWKHSHPDFCDALKLGKDACDDRVAKSLYHRATGYSFDSEKIHVTKDGDVVRVPTIEHCPPDPTSMIFWLKNRQRDKWSDRVTQEHTGPDGGPVKLSVNEMIEEIVELAPLLPDDTAQP